MNVPVSDLYLSNLKPDLKGLHKVLGFIVGICAEKVTPLCVKHKISGDLKFTSTCSGNTAKCREEPRNLRGHLSFQTACSSPVLFVWLFTFMTEGSSCLVLPAETGCELFLLPCGTDSPTMGGRKGTQPQGQIVRWPTCHTCLCLDGKKHLYFILLTD